MENKLDLVQGENICELNRQFPVIFDKSYKEYKEKMLKSTLGIKSQIPWILFLMVLYYMLATI